MRDMKAEFRGFGGPRNEVAPDPFEDLAEMFESELARPSVRPGSLNDSPRQVIDAADPKADEDFAVEFADALAVDMARSMAAAKPYQANSAYQSWIAPRAIRLTRPTDDDAFGGDGYGTAPKTPLTLQTDLEQALRGLSAPARPRGSIVIETQSFAPERVVEPWVEETAVPELDEFDELIASELAVMNDHKNRRSLEAEAFPPVAGQEHHDEFNGIEGGDPSGAFGNEDRQREPEFRGAARRGLFGRSARVLTGGVAMMALVGIAGLYFWPNMGDVPVLVASAEPPLIKADAEPFKMVPKDPGGRSIPNQNKAVYDRVASPGTAPAPVQQALLTDVEEPMDIPAEDEEPKGYDDLPGVDLIDGEGLGFKNEGRIDEVANNEAASAPVAVLQPRKVKTLIVRPDGTLMTAEVPVAAPTIAAAAASAQVAEVGASVATNDGPALGGAPALLEVASADLRQEAPEPVAYASGMVADDLLERSGSSLPEASNSVPIAPGSEAEGASAAGGAATISDPQSMVPVQIADPIEVAAVAPVAQVPPASADTAVAPGETPPGAEQAVAALPAGGYFVQISSQPSEALAQQSMQSLGSRFASVIEGRAVGIQSAEIPGKGTFFRVRVAAASKSEASSLCNRLKSAGGNCFVAR